MRIQNTSLIGLFLQEMGRLWRVSDCEELVGVIRGGDGGGFLSQLAFNPITIVGTEIGRTVKS